MMFDFLWRDARLYEVADVSPPLELYSQYFSNEVEHESASPPPADLINFDIALVSLAKSKNLNDQNGLNYIAKFLTHFCPDSINYSKLSQEGKERVDSILHSSYSFIKKAIQASNCNENFNKL